MPSISPQIWTYILCGVFAITGGFLVLYYKRNFRLYGGISLLLFFLGLVSCGEAFILLEGLGIGYTLFYLSRSCIPIFALIFSEYILKINYPAIIKLAALLLTLLLGVGSFFIQEAAPPWFDYTSEVYYSALLFTVGIYTASCLISSRKGLMRMYLIIFLFAIMIMLGNEIIKTSTLYSYNPGYQGITSLLVTHAVLLISSSGGTSRLWQKLPKLGYITVFSLLAGLIISLFEPTATFETRFTLFIFSISALSCYYLLGEVSNNSKQIGSSRLISRLLSLPLQSKQQFVSELSSWEEISGLHLVEYAPESGTTQQVNTLFEKSDRVIHKFQVPSLIKSVAYNPGFAPGVDMAQFYLNKFECHSLFQLTENGDFLAVRYIDGLNPALYTREIALMSKIIYSVSSGFKN